MLYSSVIIPSPSAIHTHTHTHTHSRAHTNTRNTHRQSRPALWIAWRSSAVPGHKRASVIQGKRAIRTEKTSHFKNTSVDTEGNKMNEMFSRQTRKQPGKRTPRLLSFSQRSGPPCLFQTICDVKELLDTRPGLRQNSLFFNFSYSRPPN